MSDLIGRLEAYRYALLAADKRMSSSSIAKLMTETIDEIERLTVRVAELEVALEKIATKRHSYKCQAHYCDHRSALDSCIDIAKNALAKLQEKDDE